VAREDSYRGEISVEFGRVQGGIREDNISMRKFSVKCDGKVKGIVGINRNEHEKASCGLDKSDMSRRRELVEDPGRPGPRRPRETGGEGRNDFAGYNQSSTQVTFGLNERVIIETRKEEREVTVRSREQKRKSLKKLRIISHEENIRKLENLPDGKTSLWVKTVPNIVECFGKFGTVCKVHEHDGISTVTFFKKYSALKALSSMQVKNLVFYERDDCSLLKLEDSLLVRTPPRVEHENQQREQENSRNEDVMKNYEADVNSYLFGIEEKNETRKGVDRTSHARRLQCEDFDEEVDPRDIEQKVTRTVFSRRRHENLPKYHIPAGEVFEDATDMSFAKEAEDSIKWKIDVKKFQEVRKADAENSKPDVKKIVAINDASKDIGLNVKEKIEQQNEVRKVANIKPARVPSDIQRKLMVLAGQEDLSSKPGEVLLRSRNSEVIDAEVIDLVESDEDEVEVVDLVNVNNNQSKLGQLQNLNENEQDFVLKSMGIVGKAAPEGTGDVFTEDISDEDSEMGLYSDGSEILENM